jgi:hypothetical protein
MLAVGSFLADLTGKAFARYGFASAGLLTDWAAIAGTDLATYARPERLRWPRPGTEEQEAAPRGATLVLRVDGARALEVQFRSSQIIARINAYFGYAAVSRLRVLQGPVAAPEALAVARTSLHRAARRGTASAAGAEVGEGAGELGGIADAPLRWALSRLGAAVRQGRPQARCGHGP